MGLVGDLCRSLTDKMLPYCNDIMQILVANLSVSPCHHVDSMTSSSEPCYHILQNVCIVRSTFELVRIQT